MSNIFTLVFRSANPELAVEDILIPDYRANFMAEMMSAQLPDMEVVIMDNGQVRGVYVKGARC